MGDTAIRVSGIGKKFRIGRKQGEYQTLRESLVQGIKAPLTRASRLLSGEASGASDLTETLWALKEVSFDVKRGEVIGIIGRNGAGKSTLLKILSRITKPSEGYADIFGRIGSLLEVGTGFHPELTGRENIYLNAAILGMKRSEIDKKLNEIIEFSGVYDLIDTPIKHYSSGMIVRLGFSVAAHLEPDILVVDEVLSVGDMDFQKKSMGKMESVASGGRTVIFVSHNMGAILRMVDRCIWLDKGRVVCVGDPKTVVASYLKEGVSSEGNLLFENDPQKAAQLTRIAIRGKDEMTTSVLDPEDDIRVDIDFTIRDSTKGRFDVVVSLALPEGLALLGFHSRQHPEFAQNLSNGEYRLQLTFPGKILNAGQYILRAAINQNHKAYFGHPNFGEGLNLELTEASTVGASGFRMTKQDELLLISPEYSLKRV